MTAKARFNPRGLPLAPVSEYLHDPILQMGIWWQREGELLVPGYPASDCGGGEQSGCIAAALNPRTRAFPHPVCSHCLSKQPVPESHGGKRRVGSSPRSDP